MVSHNKHCSAVWLNLPLSGSPVLHAAIRGKAGEARGLKRIAPSVSDVQQSPGVKEFQTRNGQGTFRRPSAALPQPRQSPAPPARFESAWRHLPAPGAPETTQSLSREKLAPAARCRPRPGQAPRQARQPQASGAEKPPRLRATCPGPRGPHQGSERLSGGASRGAQGERAERAR